MKIAKTQNPGHLCLILGAILLLPSILWAESLRVVWVYDGDTVKAETADRSFRIRLVGIDTPETSKGNNAPGQPYSRKSKKRLMQLVLKKTVTLKQYGLDDYDRVLAEIFVTPPPGMSGVADTGHRLNVNLQLVREGLAEVYGGRTPIDFHAAPYKEAQAQARQSGRGMWRQGDQYISPRVWKHRK